MSHHHPHHCEIAPLAEQPERLRPAPWLAVALAVHVLALAVAWFILPDACVANTAPVMAAQPELQALPPEQPMSLPHEIEHAFEQPELSASADSQLEPDTIDSDSGESPARSFHEIATSEDSAAHSPARFLSPVDVVGLGGGGSTCGKGGFAFRRASPAASRLPRGIGPRIGGALEWLVDHQHSSGKWRSDKFSDDTARAKARKTYNLEFLHPAVPGGDAGSGGDVDSAVTGLSLLAFLGMGYDHRSGDFRSTCRTAISYLRRVQQNNGCFYSNHSDREAGYTQAICTMAMAEAYGLSGEEILRVSAEKAVQFIIESQNPYSGWRYVRYSPSYRENDTSVTGWMILALKSADLAGIKFNAVSCFSAAAQWLDSVTIDRDGYAWTGYISPGTGSLSMQAINIITRLFMRQKGWDTSHQALRSQAAECSRNTPQWQLGSGEDGLNFYYWYYASLALYQMDGHYWKAWETPLTKTLLNNQRGWRSEDKGTSRDTLDEYGSWDAVDCFSAIGGRVYATALNCLTLEVWIRYERLHPAIDPKSEQDKGR